jgi:hypothetical protein
MRATLRLAVGLTLLSACASAPAARPRGGEAAVFQGVASSGAAGAYEAGRLSRDTPSVAGPFVLTFLGPGDEVDVVPAEGKATPLGTLTGPLATPFQVPSGAKLVVHPGDAGALYSGTRPLSLTRGLEAYAGRSILVAVGAAPAEPWTLRQVGSDHVVLERSRTYRIIPVQRIQEIQWTELAGVDPTPKLVLAALLTP